MVGVVGRDEGDRVVQLRVGQDDDCSMRMHDCQRFVQWP